MLWLLPLLPLAGALAIVLVARSRAAGTLAVLATVTLLATLAVAVWAAVQGPVAAWPWWGPQLAPGIAIVGLSRVMVVLVPLLATPVVLYAASAMRADAGLPRLLALLVAFTGAMELLVVAADFLTLLVAWELVGACSWALIGYEWRDAARPQAALDAFLTTRAGDLGLYLAAAATFAAANSLHFDALAGVRGPALHVVAAGVLVAAAAKSAQLPFSPWLFSAMAGPTAASALLHSATMVAAGAYLLAQLAPALAPTGWFSPAVAALGLATALAGGVVALAQDDLKKALAASTSGQYGLILVAIGAGYSGTAAAHLVTHAAFKALLFLAAGVVLHAAGTLDLGRLRLGTALPRVAVLSGVGVLALAAVPPMGGAYSKEQIVAAAGHASFGGIWLVAGVLAAGLLSALYAGRLHLLAFGPGGPRRLPEPTRAEVASLAFLAALSIALGLLWLPGAARLVARVTDAPLAAGAAWELVASLATVAIAATACWALWRRGALLSFGMPEAVRAPTAAWLGLPRLARGLIVVPGLALSRSLAAFDDRVVDAGIRIAMRGATFVSGALAWWGERGIDGVVTAAARATEAIGRASRLADDRGVDGAVERLAREVGVVGARSRRLQTGLAHHYYVIVAVGALVVAAAAAVGRSTMWR